MNKWLGKMNDIRLRNKLILSFVIVVFVPVILAGGYLTHELRQMALKNAIQHTSADANRIKKQIQGVLQVPINISSQLLLDEELKEFANTSYQTTWEFVKAYQNYQHFKQYLHLYSSVSNIRLYMENSTIVLNGEIVQPNYKISGSDWYQEAMENKGLIGWYYLNDRAGNQYRFLSLVRRIDFLEYHSKGLLVIKVNRFYINSLLNQEKAETFLVDANNRIIAANLKSSIGKTLKDIGFDSELSKKLNGTFEGVINGEASKVIIRHLVPQSSYNGFKIVSVFPIKTIVAQADRIVFLGLIVVLISFAVAFLLIYGFSKLLSTRLSRLSRQMDAVAKGNLDTVVTVDGNDEIGHLSMEFNEMVSNVKELMEEVRVSNEQKTLLEARQNEIKLKMMASQINPHFLFNALESIRMKAHLKGEKEIDRIVKLLGKLMRKSLKVSGEKIPLSSEIEMVRCYLEIQKFRYENRLNYDLKIDPDSEDIPIYPLIIQPLVENAVIHGLENKEDEGMVIVRSKMHGDELYIEIVDNGVGITDEKKEKIYRSLRESEEKEGSRIGLRNVHQRLRLSYGKQYGLTINSMPDVGTRIYFSIPAGGEGNV